MQRNILSIAVLIFCCTIASARNAVSDRLFRIDTTTSFLIRPVIDTVGGLRVSATHEGPALDLHEHGVQVAIGFHFTAPN